MNWSPSKTLLNLGWVRKLCNEKSGVTLGFVLGFAAPNTNSPFNLSPFSVRSSLDMRRASTGAATFPGVGGVSKLAAAPFATFQ